ncbi:MAG: transposase [Planctomycetes bacterium]|nr:transposase [Planctomycetota bacterium]
MGDRRTQALRARFDGRLKLRFHGAKITSDAGLLAFRELDEAFRLTENASAVLSDPRHGKNTQHTLLAMLIRNGRNSDGRGPALALLPGIGRELSKPL